MTFHLGSALSWANCAVDNHSFPGKKALLADHQPDRAASYRKIRAKQLSAVSSISAHSLWGTIS